MDIVLSNRSKADLFDEVITVSVNDEATGTYDLTAYANGIENEGDAKLSALLLNLYNYCREADEYAARGTLD